MKLVSRTLYCALGLGLAGCGNEGGASSPGGAAAAGMAGAAGAVAAGGAAGGGSSAGGAGSSTGGNPSAGNAGTMDGGAGGSGGASNCPAVTSALAPWPGGAEVKVVDDPDQFGHDLSGVTYEPKNGAAPAVLWASTNIPGMLFRLLKSGESYVTDQSNGWAEGKLLHYPGGSGEPDSEGVTLGESSADGVYVVAEHDNDNAGTSRVSVLLYDATGTETELSATHEWNLTAALPAFGANTGLEAVTWVPDSYLLARGFVDEAKQHAYAPREYPDHGAGLFFVGVEQTGKIYGFALDHVGGGSALLATISTPNAGVMGLEMDRDVGYLWAHCDNTCGNKASVFDVDQTAGSPTLGHFVLRRQFERPSGLPDSNNEGIAIAPESECQAGLKPFFWTDDADQDGQSIRVGSLRCGPCL